MSDFDVVERATAARRRAERSEGEASSSRWEEADAYAELSRRGWSQRRIAEECGVSQASVSIFIRCATDYLGNRPAFWDAYASVRPDKRPEPARTVWGEALSTVEGSPGEADMNAIMAKAVASLPPETLRSVMTPEQKLAVVQAGEAEADAEDADADLADGHDYAEDGWTLIRRARKKFQRAAEHGVEVRDVQRHLNAAFLAANRFAPAITSAAS